MTKSDAASPPRVDQAASIVGIGLAAIGYFVFSLQDATVKWLAVGYPVAQLMFMRAVVILPFCIVFGGVGVVRRALTSPIRLRLVWRAVVLVTAWTAYYTASRDLQLAVLTTIYFSSPLLIAVLAIPFLKERVTGIRWLSLAVGFTGVVIAARPSELGHASAVGLALLAAALWAYANILIRQVVQGESTTVVLFASNLTIAVIGALVMPFVWQPPGAHDLLLMLLVGACGAGGQFLTTEALRRAAATVIAPISFSSLIWAFFLGLAIWGEVPGLTVFVGAALILLSGAVVALGEWRGIRRAPAASAATGD